MFFQRMHANRHIMQNYEALGVTLTDAMERDIKLAVSRDLQAQILPPNTAVPPRRKVLSYLKTVKAATGSWRKALYSLAFGGAWTSTGGSFRVAEMVDVDMIDTCYQKLQQNGELVYLEVGAGWAGFDPDGRIRTSGVAALATRFSGLLGNKVHLHFTNMTRWHDPKRLPDGVTEHAFTPASALLSMNDHGVELGSVDILYSQAAAYFEPDQERFLQQAALLLNRGGMLIYNCPTEATETVLNVAQSLNMSCAARSHVGGMNGDVLVLLAGSAVQLLPSNQDELPLLIAAE